MRDPKESLEENEIVRECMCRFLLSKKGRKSQILRSVRILTVEKADYGMDQENQGSQERERGRGEN